ncbi:5-methylthioribose kinase [Dinoroseobacter shibae DFL 12 = DSM 16493]|jgi:5-methylthioribose kinase|uniref:S-methyl-5-thioribose kinase n=1 Tax=Dinoroseobacter shibae (strain DSM 16493 / NCIMB 14021 / DFL 12) TaxID=398580 RepID=A8LNV8_DINSH|nr:S-methyl-5-thioribose kinase [Dinoroseobacter shibae]ABV92266.1 5-methylthioribose kinase [Dinoroseobacter shibae DFL 12 = DSM 16493]URF47220.1 S-methyl-5-thioribose kinase [Dinoroseobacter shibae]URF51531.1 S-methyl-5-thioribose kinase [Dinoroseobacter shibae]
MGAGTAYEALTVETLPERLRGVSALASRVGNDPGAWQVEEVGDGNLNLVFIVSGPSGKVIVKQALPYVRLVGDSWPLPLYRAYFEYHALTRQAARDPGAVPTVYHFDEAQALIIMEYLSPHVILRRKLIAGEHVAGLAAFLGRFCARTAFRGSELSMPSPEKKADVALFAGNVEIPAITEALVFTDPYFDAEMNSHTEGLEPVIARLRADVGLKVKVQQALQRFVSNTETMVHGDLHSGSIMSTDSDSRVIDPEFVQYGPLGFDIGMLCANFLMAYFSQPAHRGEDLATYQEWILSVIADTCSVFEAEFRDLWRSERTGILYPQTLFEDQGQDSTPACDAVLAEIWRDAWAVCGIEMHRRCLSLAHNADFEDIADVRVRAPLEARNLLMGAELIHSAATLADAKAVCALARDFNRKDVL